MGHSVSLTLGGSLEHTFGISLRFCEGACARRLAANFGPGGWSSASQATELVREPIQQLKTQGQRMTVAAQRYKILANMFSRAIRNLDQIQNCSTAHACEFDQSKVDKAKDAIHDVVQELEAKAKSDLI